MQEKTPWIIQGLRRNSARPLNKRLWIFLQKLFENISRNSPWRAIKTSSKPSVKYSSLCLILPPAQHFLEGQGEGKLSDAPLHSFTALFRIPFTHQWPADFFYVSKTCNWVQKRFSKLFLLHSNVASLIGASWSTGGCWGVGMRGALRSLPTLMILWSFDLLPP